MTTRPSDRATTLTTPEALALLDADIASCGLLEPADCEDCARIRQARDHLASRIAELDTLLTATTQRLSNAEAELAAVRVLPEKWRSEHIPVDGCCAKTYNTTLDALAYEVEANIAKAAREGK